MKLAGMAAAAQTNDEDITTQREQAENWNYYQQSTRVPPAEFKAWTQAKERAGTSTEPPAQAAAPVPPGQPGWLIVSLRVLAAALALVAGLALVAARRANRRARVGQTA
jgi:hypothetical protein